MNLKYFWTAAFTCCISSIAMLAQPKATLVSSDQSYCKHGMADLKIRFEGEAPFGIVYQITEKGSEFPFTYTHLGQNIFEEVLEDGVWTTKTSTINSTSEITLVQVFDSTIPSTDWVYTPTNNTNGSTDVSGTFLVTIDEMPVANAGSISPVCGYEASLNATPSLTNTSFIWTIAAGGTFDDNTLPNPVFTAEDAGTYTLTLTEINGSCSDDDQTDVKLLGSPQSVLSGSQNICSTDGTTYTMDVNASISHGTAPYTYTLTDGINSFVRTNINGTDNLSVQLTQATTYRITTISDANNCIAHIDSIQGEATATDYKPNANAGLAADWCEADLSNGYTLGAELDKDQGGTWLATNGITFTNGNDPNSMAMAVDYGTYTLVWQETYNGCSETASVDITFINPPGLELLKPDTAICEGASALMRIKTTSNYYPLQFIYSDGTDQSISLNDDYNEIALNPSTTDGQTSYALTSLTDTRGCASALQTQFAVDVDFIPVPLAGVYDAICGPSVTLDAMLGAGETGIWSSDTGTLSDDQSATSEYTITFGANSAQETGTLEWKVLNMNNPNCRDSVEINLTFDKEPGNVFAGNDTTIYNTDQIQLTATGLEAGMQGAWYGAPGSIQFNNATSGTTVASNLQEGQNELTWVVSNGICPDVESLIMVMAKPLTNPNGFSPNGDGINDLFRIGGADNVMNNKFIVFDINGKVVYEEANFGNPGWNGTGLDGQALRYGTYYYVFTGDGVSIKDYLIIKE